MTTSRTLTVASLTGLCALTVAAVAPAAAQKRAGGRAKVVRACNIAVVPLSVGNSWTYEAIQHPTPLSDKETKLLPSQPRKIVVTVDEIEPTKDGALIKLTEDVDGRKLATTATCTATSLTFSPDSILFAGEPGGTWNVAWDAMTRKGTTFPIAAGKLASYEWNDDLSATWKRVASEGTHADLGAGTIKLERRLVVTADEAVGTQAGTWRKAAKLGIQTRGQIAIDGVEGAPYELPDGIVSWYWQVDDVGVVQIHNSFMHAYQLTAYTVAK